MDEARGKLSGIGIILEDLHFFVEIWNIYLVVSMIYLYFYLHIPFSYLIDVHYILGGLVVDFEAVKRSYLKVVLKQAWRLVESSENYHQLCKEELQWRSSPGDRSTEMPSRQTMRLASARHKQDHLGLIERLRATILEGLFGPLTWDHKWLFRMGLVNICVSTCFWSYTLALAVLLYFGIPMMEGKPFDWWQLLRSSDQILLSILSLLAASFYIPIVAVSNLDHLRHINKLLDMIRGCKLKNQLVFSHIVDLIHSKTQHQMEARQTIENQWNIRYQCRQLNDNLLFVLVHYRISVCLSRSLEKSSTVFMVGGVVLLFVLPVQNLLHAPYLNSRLAQETFFYVSAGHMVLFNLMMVPMCYLRSRAFDLYKTMSSLLAHSIECQTILDTLKEPDQVYDAHLVGLLRKELDDPAMMARQFTFVVLGVNITYPNLLRIHFWFGLLMLVVINGLASRNSDLFGHFFADPFNLF